MKMCPIVSLVVSRFDSSESETIKLQCVVDRAFFMIDEAQCPLQERERSAASIKRDYTDYLRKHVRCSRTRKYIRDLLGVATGAFTFAPIQYLKDAMSRKELAFDKPRFVHPLEHVWLDFQFNWIPLCACPLCKAGISEFGEYDE